MVANKLPLLFRLLIPFSSFKRIRTFSEESHLLWRKGMNVFTHFIWSWYVFTFSLLAHNDVFYYNWEQWALFTIISHAIFINDKLFDNSIVQDLTTFYSISNLTRLKIIVSFWKCYPWKWTEQFFFDWIVYLV